MGLHTDDLPWELRELAKWLTDGKPEVGWRGDPRLTLKVGVLSAAQSGWSGRAGRFVKAGEPVARRYEVWRHTEEGEDVMIGDWHPKDWHHILKDLIEMDPRTPGHQSTINTMRRHNERMEAENSRRFQEMYGQLLQHAHYVHRKESSDPDFKFTGIPGQNPDKQD